MGKYLAARIICIHKVQLWQQQFQVRVLNLDLTPLPPTW